LLYADKRRVSQMFLPHSKPYGKIAHAKQTIAGVAKW
jgi:hypothetical protein